MPASPRALRTFTSISSPTLTTSSAELTCSAESSDRGMRTSVFVPTSTSAPSRSTCTTVARIISPFSKDRKLCSIASSIVIGSSGVADSAAGAASGWALAAAGGVSALGAVASSGCACSADAAGVSTGCASSAGVAVASTGCVSANPAVVSSLTGCCSALVCIVSSCHIALRPPSFRRDSRILPSAESSCYGFAVYLQIPAIHVDSTC